MSLRSLWGVIKNFQEVEGLKNTTNYTRPKMQLNVMFDQRILNSQPSL